MPTIFINRFYWPSESATGQLLTDLAEGLAERGREVIVITSRPPGAPRRETRRGVRIERVAGARWTASRSLVLKALDFGAFYLSALLRLARRRRPGDAVVALTDPPLIGVGLWLLARRRNTRCFHWVQDIYPEIALALSGQSLLRLASRPRNLAWRQAAGCVALGQDMAAVITAAGVPPDRVHVVPNWPPAGLWLPDPAAVQTMRRTWGLDGKFVVAYSGNLGRVHELGAILETAAVLQTDPDIVFLFVGGGARREELSREARRRRLPNVQFRPAQSRESLGVALAAGDAHLVTLRPECASYVFPSKIYGIAAVGRPIVFIGPPACEPARIVTGSGFGHAFTATDVTGIAGALTALSRDPGATAALSARALAFASSRPFSSVIETWDKILEIPGPQPR